MFISLIIKALLKQIVVKGIKSILLANTVKILAGKRPLGSNHGTR